MEASSRVVVVTRDEEEEEDGDDDLGSLLDEQEALFEVEGKEKTVYCIDGSEAMVKEGSYVKAIGYVQEQLREMIKEGSTDMVGVTIFGHENSKKAVRVIPLGKVNAFCVMRLKELLDDEAFLDEIPMDRVFESQQPALRNALWSARSQLENSKESGKNSTKTITVFSCENGGIRVEDSLEVDSVLILARDARDTQVRLNIVYFSVVEDDAFWKRLLTANLSEETDDWRQQFFVISDASANLSATHTFLQKRKRVRGCGSLELSFLHEPDKCIRPRLKKVPMFTTVKWPKQVFVHQQSGELLRSVNTKEDEVYCQALGPRDIRKYQAVGETGRAYSEANELLKCGHLSSPPLVQNLRGDGELLILGFLKANEVLMPEFFLSRGKRTDVLIADDDQVPASSEALASLVAAMHRQQQVAIALYVTASLTTDKNRSNPCISILEPKISHLPPSPCGLLLHPLPFQHERLIHTSLTRPRPESISQSLQDASDSLVQSLAERNNLSENPALIARSPSVAAKWAAFEGIALDDNDDSVLKAVLERTASIYPTRTASSEFASALDALIGTQVDLDRATDAQRAEEKKAEASKKRKRENSHDNNDTAITRKKIPADLLRPHDNESESKWTERLNFFEKPALINAAISDLGIAHIPPSWSKPKILARMAQQLFASSLTSIGGPRQTSAA